MPALDDFWIKFKARNEKFSMPFKKKTQIGLLPAVISQANQGEFRQIFTRQDGKTPKAVYKYKQRKLASSVKITAIDGAPNYCNASEVPAYLQAEQEITKDVYQPFLIPYEDVRGYEESFEKVLEDEIQAGLNAMLVKLDSLLIADYEALRGSFKGGSTTPLSLQGFSSLATFTINHAFEIGIYNAFRAIDYTGQKILVGDTLVNNFYRELMRGAPNSERGQINATDLMREFSFYDDAILDGEIGTNNTALAWEAGNFQMLEWFKNEGDFRLIDGKHIRDTMTVNVNGVLLKFDIYMTENFCNDATSGVNVTIRKHYDTWAFPDDIFNASDPIAGSNGLLRFTMTAGT